MASELMEIYAQRAALSEGRLGELRNGLAGLNNLLEGFPTLTVYGVGSYARLEASEHSDIDMFFISRDEKKALKKPNETSLRLFGRLIEIVVYQLHFPEFSSDCQFLKLLHAPDIVRHLGGPTDDHMNYFTARMLLLLESICLYGDSEFDEIKTQIIHSYFQDYPTHESDFVPVFLLNDICRYWKTLLLNYENKRKSLQGLVDAQANLSGDELAEARTAYQDQKVKQKVKNFKLKYSRMTTCFASLALLGSYPEPVTEAAVFDMTKLTPHQRLDSIATLVPQAEESVRSVLEEYAWFLQMTALKTEDLEAHFRDDGSKAMFDKANQYGGVMFEMLKVIGQSNTRFPFLRYLVI